MAGPGRSSPPAWPSHVLRRPSPAPGLLSAPSPLTPAPASPLPSPRGLPMDSPENPVPLSIPTASVSVCLSVVQIPLQQARALFDQVQVRCKAGYF